MSGPTFPIGTMINEMFVLAFLVVVESVRLLLGQQHEPVSFIKLFMHTGLIHMQLTLESVSKNQTLKNILILFELPCTHIYFQENPCPLRLLALY